MNVSTPFSVLGFVNVHGQFIAYLFGIDWVLLPVRTFEIVDATLSNDVVYDWSAIGIIYVLVKVNRRVSSAEYPACRWMDTTTGNITQKFLSRQRRYLVT